MSEAVADALGSLGEGSALGRYELLLPIAQGGMATVWAARMKGSRGFAKIVAIKTMLPALSQDPRFEEMFLAEAEIASKIKHPNVCEILDLGEQDGVLYLAMEWLDAEPLVTLERACQRARRALPHGVAARLVIDAARGLHAAHELRDEGGAPYGVVHRDVSPHNILVSLDGHVKIVDFGVAKACARADQPRTRAGHLKGKVQYMAPEQATGDPLDRCTDVFALGVVLYQLTTGIHPFRGDNELATLSRLTRDAEVEPPGSVSPGYPEALAAVVMRALVKAPAGRFPTMLDFACALEAALPAITAPGEPCPADFVSAVLRERAEARRSALKEALRAADERALLGEGAMPIDSAAAPSMSSAGMVMPERFTSSPPRGGRGRSLVLSAALVALGAVLGATGLVWVSKHGGGSGVSVSAFERVTATPASGAATSLTEASERGVDEAAVRAPEVMPPRWESEELAPARGPEPVLAIAPSAVPRTLASPTLRATPKPSAVAPVKLIAGPRRTEGRAKFRSPGF